MTPRVRVSLVAAVLAACFAGGLLLAADASAHATLVSSDPADSARLRTVPSVVSIRFDESVGLGSFGYLHVTDAHGARVESGAAYHPGGDGSQIAVALQHGLSDGTYVESYRVVSADSHPVAGVVRFVVGTGPLLTTAAAPSTPTDPGVGVVFDVARWLSWAGVALFGGSWLLLTVWPAGGDDRRARLIVWTGWGAAVVGAAAELALQGAYAAGSGFEAVFRPSLVDATLHTTYGEVHAWRLLLLGILALLFARGLQAGRTRAEHPEVAALVGIGIAATFAAAGHADTTDPSWLSIAADSLHVAAMSVWVGGLVIVVAVLLPRRDPDELRTVLPSFSRVAFASVIVLAVTGTYAAWRGVSSWRALGTTEYGWLVIAKVVLFVGLLLVGNLSRRVIAQRYRRPVAYAMTDSAVADRPRLDATQAERMRRGVLVEVAVAAVVLGVTSVLVVQPRGAEALATRDRQPVSSTVRLGGGQTASVTVDPGEHGTVAVDIELGASTRARSVTATAALPSRQYGPLPLHLVADSAGGYTAGGVELPDPGDWVFELVVTRSRFDAVTADATIHLK